VYFVERYRERRSLFPAEPQLDATAESAREIWTPCLYSCTTTMAGFASLLTSGVNPVRTFGIMMTIGMGVGLACVFLFLPSLSKPLRPLEVKGADAASVPRGIVKGMTTLVLRAPGPVLLAGAALLGAAIWGTTRLKVETKFIDYFWPRSEVYQGLQYIDTRMGGTTPLEVMLTSKEPGFFRTEAGLEAVAAAAGYFGPVTEAKNVRSLKTLMDEARKAFKKITVEQAAKLAPEQVREFANADFTVSRVLIRFQETAPTLHRRNILRGLEDHLERHVRPLGIQARPTGVFLLYSNMLESLLKSQRDTFLMVLGAIYVMLVVLFRSAVLAGVVLLPQVLPVFVCLGTMGLTGIPLDLVTVMIASIAMGVGIDAAIQYTVRFRIELEAAGGDLRAAVPRTHATIGRAIWIATSIVVVGFVVLAFSRFVPSVYFGVFTGLAMLMSQFAALTLLPALFLVLRLPRPRAKDNRNG
jgi:predicted RND superfamily exporter protein